LSSAGITVGGSSYELVNVGLSVPSLSVSPLSIAGSSAAAAHTNVQPYLAMNAFIKT
jgi:microcystin-dependent protein